MNDALEQRAWLYLLTLLGRERMQAWGRDRAGLTAADPDEGRSARLRGFESVVETFRALGVLSRADTQAWRRRFEAAGADPAAMRSPEPDAETRRRAEDFIRVLFEEQRTGKGGSPKRRAGTFRGAVFALGGVGAVPTEEAHQWNARLHTELGLPTREEEEQRERARTCTALDLRAVIAAPMEIGGLQVSHLELYADGALLYSLERHPAGGAPAGAACGSDPSLALPFREQEKSPLAVSDDLGTVYEPRQYHGFAKALTPAVPDGASRLEIAYGQKAGAIALR